MAQLLTYESFVLQIEAYVLEGAGDCRNDEVVLKSAQQLPHWRQTHPLSDHKTQSGTPLKTANYSFNYLITPKEKLPHI